MTLESQDLNIHRLAFYHVYNAALRRAVRVEIRARMPPFYKISSMENGTANAYFA